MHLVNSAILATPLTLLRAAVMLVLHLNFHCLETVDVAIALQGLGVKMPVHLVSSVMQGTFQTSEKVVVTSAPPQCTQ